MNLSALFNVALFVSAALLIGAMAIRWLFSRPGGFPALGRVMRYLDDSTRRRGGRVFWMCYRLR